MKPPGVRRCTGPSGSPAPSAPGLWAAVTKDELASICEMFRHQDLAKQAPLLAQLGCEIHVVRAHAARVGLREKADVTGTFVVPAGVIQDGIEADALNRHTTRPGSTYLRADVVK